MLRADYELLFQMSTASHRRPAWRFQITTYLAVWVVGLPPSGSR